MKSHSVFAAILGAVLIASTGLGQGTRAQNDIPILHVQGNVYMLVGDTGNATVQIGDDGVLVVDTMTETAANAMLTAIRTLSPKPIRWIINTHVHRDRTGGNAVLGNSGKFFAGNTRKDVGALILAHDDVLQAMQATSGKYSTGSPAWPTNTYFSGQKDLFFDGEAVEIFHEPNAHTSGDSVVFFRRSDVVSTGDVFTPDRFPVIDFEQGGGVNGLIAALNHILRLTVPELNQEGGTMVIPGSGHLCDEADVADYRDMVTIVRDRVQDLIKKGMSLEQVKASRPSRDYDPLYGRPEYTGEMFVEAVYRSLTVGGKR
jgi:glyoxylase-like metal-dependent hydrolase (beta-lactamase superfamily II)